MLSPSKGQYLNPFFYHICDRKSKQSTSTSHVYTYFIIWKQLDDFHLYFTMSKSNVKDNLCRSELIKVRLFDENFFRFLQEIIPLWCLDNELRCFGEKNAWFISFVINCYVLQIFWVFPCTALCVTLIMMVSADCSQNNSDPSWAGQRLHAFQRFLDCTAQHNTILRLTQELQLIMFNQVFIFRHAAGFTYGITEQWKMSFVEIFSLSSRISLSQDVKWDYTKYSINQRD